jgi:hypothetical protein
VKFIKYKSKIKSLLSFSELNLFINSANELKVSLLPNPNQNLILYIDSLIQHAKFKFSSSAQQLISQQPKENVSSKIKLKPSSFNTQVVQYSLPKTNLSKGKEEIISHFHPVTSPSSFQPIDEEINQISSIDKQIFSELDELNIDYTAETKNSVLIKVIQLFKKLIFSSIPKSKTEIENFEQIIFNQTSSKSFQQFQQALQPYFGNETGTNEEIIEKYTEKFKTIQANLLTIQQHISSQSSQSYSLVSETNEISQQISTEIQTLSKIQNLLFQSISPENEQYSSHDLLSISQSLQESVNSKIKEFNQLQNIIIDFMNILDSRPNQFSIENFNTIFRSLTNISTTIHGHLMNFQNKTLVEFNENENLLSICEKLFELYMKYEQTFPTIKKIYQELFNNLYDKKNHQNLPSLHIYLLEK